MGLGPRIRRWLRQSRCRSRVALVVARHTWDPAYFCPPVRSGTLSPEPKPTLSVILSGALRCGLALQQLASFLASSKCFGEDNGVSNPAALILAKRPDSSTPLKTDPEIFDALCYEDREASVSRRGKPFRNWIGLIAAIAGVVGHIGLVDIGFRNAWRSSRHHRRVVNSQSLDVRSGRHLHRHTDDVGFGQPRHHRRHRVPRQRRRHFRMQLPTSREHRQRPEHT